VFVDCRKDHEETFWSSDLAKWWKPRLDYVQHPAFVRQTMSIMCFTLQPNMQIRCLSIEKQIHRASQHVRRRKGKQSNTKTSTQEQKSSHTWSLPISSIVVVELLERAKAGIVVVDDLLESGIANTAHRLPVFAR
jgi:hypothetical protein